MCDPSSVPAPAPGSPAPRATLRPVVGHGKCPSCRRVYKARQGDGPGRVLHECDRERIELDGMSGPRAVGKA